MLLMSTPLDIQNTKDCSYITYHMFVGRLNVKVQFIKISIYTKGIGYEEFIASIPHYKPDQTNVKKAIHF